MSEQLKHNEVTLVREGTKIVIPPPMTYDQAIQWLQTERDAENQRVNFAESVPGTALEIAVAFNRVLKRRYGHISSTGDTMEIQVHPDGTKETCFVDKCTVPGISAPVYSDWHGGVIAAQKVRRGELAELKALAAEVREEIETNSIYRGHAVKLGGGITFMPLLGNAVDTLIFSESVLSQLRAGLWAPIRHTTVCRKANIPLKRGVLLYGPYGTGKTLTAAATAEIAVANGWTFVYLENSEHLGHAINFCKRFQPAVLFVEDIDRQVDADRDDTANYILNTIDAIDGKDHEIMVVMTTNHLEVINPAMLRPGRIDLAVEVLPPDAVAAARLVKQYGGDVLADNVDLRQVGQALDGKIPAVIREVVERSKLASISRTGGIDLAGSVDTSDLLLASRQIEVHARLCTPRPAVKERTEFAVEIISSTSDSDVLSAAVIGASQYLNGAAQ